MIDCMPSWKLTYPIDMLQKHPTDPFGEEFFLLYEVTLYKKNTFIKLPSVLNGVWPPHVIEPFLNMKYDFEFS